MRNYLLLLCSLVMIIAGCASPEKKIRADFPAEDFPVTEKTELVPKVAPAVKKAEVNDLLSVSAPRKGEIVVEEQKDEQIETEEETAVEEEPSEELSPEIPAEAETSVVSEEIPEPRDEIPPVEPAVHHNQRLQVYATRVDNWIGLTGQMESLDMAEPLPGMDKCIKLAGQVYRGYRYLVSVDTEAPSGQGTPDGFSVNLGVYAQDGEYLEQGCEAVLLQGEKLVNQWVSGFNTTVAEQAEMVISYYAEKGRIEETLLAYRDLSETYPDWKISPEIKILYGKALLESGELTESAAILKEVFTDKRLPEIEKWALQRNVADLLLATGRVEEAKRLYQSLVELFAAQNTDEAWVSGQLALLDNVELHAEEMTFYMAVLQAYLVFDGRQLPQDLRIRVKSLGTAFPGSLFTFQARELLGQAEDQARGWVEKRLSTVAGLVEGKEFTQALEILDGMLAGKLLKELRFQVEQTRQEVLFAEKQELEAQRLMLEQSLAIQWEDALKLVDLQRYDEAISSFQLLLGTEFEKKAEEQIIKSGNLAAIDLRRRAASLFVKARKTVDANYKTELLLESHRLLNEILVKYPDAEIVAKVLQNLKILEEQIYRFDPTLLNKPDAAEIEPGETEGENYEPTE
ncbi:MAG: hypothetical protein KKE17_02795 [Proteobacteria bacterium]|nr:hypothetical protein [Pseudomonadota bacterium]MBU1708910.1 hypothetical protein [Pseudomonadota bacterium]